MSCYIGPYAKLTKTLELVRVDLCATHNFQSSNFCPSCGKSWGSRFTTKTIPEIPIDWDQKNLGRGEDTLFCDYLARTNKQLLKNNGECVLEELLLPNRFWGTLGIEEINAIANDELENAGHGSMMNLDMNNSVLLFKDLFNEELEYASTLFDVSVDFGFVLKNFN